MHILIIDTSSILFCLSNNIDLLSAVNEAFPGYGIAVSKGIIKELNGLSNSRKRSARYAGIAVRMLKRANAYVFENDENADKWLIEIAGPDKTICTNDSKLRRALRARGANVVSVARDGKLR